VSADGPAESFSCFFEAFQLFSPTLSDKEKSHVDPLRRLRTAPRRLTPQAVLPGGDLLPEGGGGEKRQENPHGSFPKSPSL
jgi:hypothetical protein